MSTTALTRTEKNALRQAFYDVRQPSALTGINSLTRAVSRSNRRLTRKRVAGWLSGEEAYVLHRQKRKRFLRSKIFAAGPNSLWESDLTFVDKMKRYNDGVKYLLVVVDVFSKVAAVEPLKNKSAKSTAMAFEKIIRRLMKKVPEKLRTDRGTEYNNSTFRRLMTKYGIHHYMTFDADIKAGVAERFNRTLKGRLYRYMTAYKTKRYLAHLQDIVDGYNSSFHRSIGMAPNKVTRRNARLVWEKLYGEGRHRTMSVRPKLKVGQRVLIPTASDVFARGYTENWKREPFTVTHVTLHHPYRYKLSDQKGEILKGSFYESELQELGRHLEF
jgi:hypothetical protein